MSTKIGHFFHRKVADNFYLVSCPEWETEKAPVVSWMVIGDEKAVLIDAGLPVIGLRKYAEKLAGKPVELLLTHGHYDHAGALDEFDEFWIHPADEILLHGNEETPATAYHGILHPLYSGEVVNLGKRELYVYGAEGHTKGSLLFYDEQSRILISGDSIGRRFYCPNVHELPMSKFFDDLLKLESLGFQQIASAHDFFLLPKEQINYLMTTICTKLENANELWNNGIQDMLVVHAGDGPTDLKYVSYSIPLKYKAEVLKDIQMWKERTNWRDNT